MPNDETGILVRAARNDDAEDIARIWQKGWREVHLGQVPESLVTARTPSSFLDRAVALTADTTVAVVNGAVAGFVMVEGDEVQQVYVDAVYRGTAVAAQLLSAAERRIAEEGFTGAWLAVVAANQRARRFYARVGWTDEGPFDHAAPGPDGPITVSAHCYRKQFNL